ncbi:MAG: hypothetical protein V7609_70 [Verrucomicrobiota bacterium]
MPNVGQELLNVPFAEMVHKLAIAIADGQFNLDKNSTAIAKFMAETTIALPSIADPTKDIPFPLISLGFFPGYYQFAETIIEVKMAITMATSSEAKIGVSAKAGWGPFSASVNASYSSKYSYDVSGSSLLRTKLVPVPPPAILQEYMEALMKKMSAPVEAEKIEGEKPPK